MKRRGFLGLVAGAAFGAMLNVFPAFAPEPTFSIHTLRMGIRQDFIDAYRRSYDAMQERIRSGLRQEDFFRGLLSDTGPGPYGIHFTSPIS